MISQSKEEITSLANISRSRGLGLVFWEEMASYEFDHLGVGHLTQHGRRLV